MPTQAANHPHISRDVQHENGKVIQAKRTLRACEAPDNLNIKGMFRSTITTNKGATCKGWVYVVAGHRPEPLLGDKDAGKLGIIRSSPEGREPTKKEWKAGSENWTKRTQQARIKAQDSRQQPDSTN